MAIVVDLVQSYDQATSNDQDVAMGIHMIDPVDTPLQLMLPKVPVTATTVEWIEDALIPTKTTLAATVSDTTGTEITVASGQGTAMFPTDMATYSPIIKIDQEYFLVTAESSDVLTVTRGYGSTTAAVHANAANVSVISVPEPSEGAAARVPLAVTRTRPSNYVQTFARTVLVTGVQEIVRKLGGVTSELAYQLMKESRHLALELESTLLYGVKEQLGTRTTRRTMGGLWKLIATNRQSDSGAIDTAAIETDIRTIWDAGGIPSAIVTTGKLAQDITTLYADRIRSDVVTQLAGANITAIINPLAQGPLFIIPHRLVMEGEYFMLDLNRLAMGYLRPFFRKQLSEDGDFYKLGLYGDYTLEAFNEKAHAYRFGFS